MVVHRHAGTPGEQFGITAPVSRDAVDVPEEVEGDPAAVRGDVQRHPGAFFGGEVDLAGLAPGEGHVPFVGVVLGLLRGEGGSEDLGGEKSGGHCVGGQPGRTKDGGEGGAHGILPESTRKPDPDVTLGCPVGVGTGLRLGLGVPASKGDGPVPLGRGSPYRPLTGIITASPTSGRTPGAYTLA